MRVLFRLWVVWAVIWIAAISFGDGFSGANFKALMLILGGPLAVVLLLRWIVKPRAAQR